MIGREDDPNTIPINVPFPRPPIDPSLPPVVVTPNPKPNVDFPNNPVTDPGPARGGSGGSYPGGGFDHARLPPGRRVGNSKPPQRQHHKGHAHRKHPELNPHQAPPGLKLNVSASEMALLVALGVIFLPEGAVATAVYGMNVISLGVLSEMAALEVFVTPLTLQVMQRTGLLLAGGKGLNLFGMFKQPENKQLMSHTNARNLAKLGTKWIINQAEKLGGYLGHDEVILWSKFRDGVRVSQEFAQNIGGKTVEMTPGGAWLDSLRLFADNSPFTPQEAIDIWEKFSLHALSTATGKVKVIRGGEVTEQSILKKEIALLDKKPGVTIQHLDFRPVIRYKK